ncbi:hypothetical protein DMENIID0001_028580 [Sergentomyia squamirostris]
MSTRNKFNETFTWLIISFTSEEESLKKLEDLDLRWDSEIFLVTRESDDEKLIRVTEVYGIKRAQDSLLLTNLVGFWNGENFRISTEFQRYSKIQRRLDLKGAEIYGALLVKHIPPGFTVLETLQQHIDPTLTASAMEHALLSAIFKRANATLIIRRTSTWSQLSVTVNESWVGVIGMLNNNLADLSITLLSNSAARFPYVWPTAHSWTPQFGFVFRHPRSVSVREAYLQPFDNILWICTCCLLVILSICFVIILKFHREAERSTTAFAFLGIFGTFFQQSISKEIHSISGRILLITGLVFSFLCYQFYSSFIVASLITDPPKTIRTVEDLANSKLRIGAIDFISNDGLFNVSNPAVRTIYAERVKKPRNFFSVEKGVEMIKAGGFAYHYDVLGIYEKMVGIFTEDEICDLQEVTFLRVIPASAFVRKTSPYRELINVLTRRLTEAGVVQHEQSKWFVSKPKCYSSRVSVTPVDVEHVFTPLVTILIVSVLSLFILIAEIWTKRRNVFKRRFLKKSVLQMQIDRKKI